MKDRRQEGLPPSEADRELERLLRSLPHPTARPAFRSGLRQRFLEGGATAPGTESRAETTVRKPLVMPKAFEPWLREIRITPPAGETFRDKLRRLFLASEPAARAQTGEQGRRSRLRLVLIPLLAAAAILAVTFLLPQDPRWKISGLRGEPVEVTGTRLEERDLERLTAELTRGAVLRTQASWLDLTLEDALDLQVLPNTEIEFAALPDLDGSTPLRFSLRTGEVFLRTRAGYPGNPLRVETGEVEVGASGTIFGVLVDDRGTCVCVVEGEVVVKGALGDPPEKRVASETSYLVFRGGTMGPKEMTFAAADDPAHQSHTQALIGFARR